jgi:hypothetical protein
MLVPGDRLAGTRDDTVKLTEVKLTENHLRTLVMACGLLLVALGAAKGIFGLTLGEKPDRWVCDGLFFGAALAFLQLFKLRRQARDAVKKP